MVNFMHQMFIYGIRGSNFHIILLEQADITLLGVGNLAQFWKFAGGYWVRRFFGLRGGIEFPVFKIFKGLVAIA